MLKIVKDYLFKNTISTIVLVIIILFVVVESVKVSQSMQVEIVDITSLLNSFVKETANLNISDHEKSQLVKKFSVDLQQDLEREAKQKHVIILPREAVLAGGIDITENFAKSLKAEVNE